MKFQTLSSLFIFVLFGAIGCTEEAKDPPPAEPSVAAENSSGYGWLFIHSGLKTTLETTDEGTYSLTMEGVSRVIGFTERPSHVIEHLNVLDYKALWERTGDNSFQASPPNASLSFVLNDDQRSEDFGHLGTMIVTLSEPTFTEEAADGSYTVTYKLTNVDATEVPDGFLDTLPVELHDSELVIDDFWSSVGCTFCKAGMAAMTTAIELLMDAGGEGEVEAAAVITAGALAKASGVAFAKSTAVQEACHDLADVLSHVAIGVDDNDAKECLDQLCISHVVLIISTGGQAFAPIAGWALGQIGCGCKNIAEACN